MGVDAIVSLVSLFWPKVIDTVKGWIHRKDSPEATMASLAQTNPAALADYVKAQADFIRAKVEQFNQDMPVITLGDSVPQWVVALWWLLRIYRGWIRPGLITLAAIHVGYLTATANSPAEAVSAISSIPEWIRYQYEVATGSWFGDRWK